MSNSSKPRVVRKHKVSKKYTRHTYPKAKPLLLDDFGNRCAYSQVHMLSIGESAMHIDHHDPTKKRLSSYDNLFPAYSICNQAKGETWPGRIERRLGLRFLNPCKETEYGVEIFEDPTSNELVGTSPAACYHIDMLDLNNPALVEHRRERAALLKILHSPVLDRSRSSKDEMARGEITRELIRLLALKVPEIPPPPPGSRP